MLLKRSNKFLASLLVSTLFLTACQTQGTDDNEEPDQETSSSQQETESSKAEESSESDEGNDNGEQEVSQDLKSWFPPLEDTYLEYEGEGNEFAAFTRYPQFTHEDTLQMAEATGGTTIVRIYEYSDNQVEEIFSRPETYFREDFTDTGLASGSDNLMILLQKPIELNHSWESPNGAVSEITGLDVEVETPLGRMEALEVTSTHDGYTTLSYYAEGIGLIKRVAEQGENQEDDVTSTLMTFDEETAEKLPVTIYSLDDEALNIVSHPVEFEFYTNDPVRVTLADYMAGRESEEEIGVLLPEETEINYMYLRQDGIAAVDFSKELIENMNAGAGIEAMILQAVVNTIGDYYDVEEILLTVEEEPYSSGHILLQEDETMRVDYGNQ